MICPNCHNKISDRRLDGDTRLYVCDSCGTRVKTKETIEAIEDGMCITEKVTNYLLTHKTPITTKKLADRFLVKPSTVNGALRRLEANGKAKRTKVGKIDHWSYKATPFDMAVPKEPDSFKSPSIHTFNRPIQNSYPAVRGYDD